MNKISSFLVGTLSTMGLAESLGLQPETLDAVQTLPIDSPEAVVSVIGGAISTIIVTLLKRWWKKLDEKKKRTNTT
ncbi:hypothetical protein [Marinifilum sp.]|uniref:hypothetical protein n=1 Tax=Marinifilum sp. TaxID=2033137 RepID=UPI003BAB9A39